MNLRPLAIGSAVVLTSCLAVGASASAFAASGPHAATAASSRATTAATITDVQQAPLRLSSDQYVKVTVAVSGDTVVRLLDPTGEVVQVEDGSPGSPVGFLVKPTGADTARYTVDTGQGSTARAVDLDFRGLPLSAPANLTSEKEVDRISAAVARGQLTHEIEYEALPGAEVTVVVNGRSTVAHASEYGVATVVVEFRNGGNEVRAKQVLGAKQSIEAVESYVFGNGEQPGDGNEGGEQPGGGNEGGEQPGDSDQGGEHVDRGSLRIDQEQGAELTPEDGTVTISGRASGGWVTATDRDRHVLATTKVENGRWSVDVPAAAGRQVTVIGLSPTEHGAAVAEDVLNYLVTDSGEQPGAGNEGGGEGGEQTGDGDQGGEQTGDGDQGGEHVDRGSLRIDQEQGAELTPEDGTVTISGRASGGWVTATDRDRHVLATAKVEDGHWSVDVPAAAGRQVTVIGLSATEHGAAVAEDVLNYLVTDSGEQPGAGNGEQPGDGGAVAPVTELAVDQSGSVRLDAHGFATFTGTATGDSVRVLVNGKQAEEFPVTDGHFTADLYQRPGEYRLTFMAKSHGNVWDVVKTISITVEG